jgi:hypothetical protein
LLDAFKLSQFHGHDTRGGGEWRQVPRNATQVPAAPVRCGEMRRRGRLYSGTATREILSIMSAGKQRVLGLTAAIIAVVLIAIGWRAHVRPAKPPADRQAPQVAGLSWRLKPSSAGARVEALVEKEEAGSLEIRGAVLDPTENPVAGATVAVDSSPPRAVVTAENGTFSLTGLLPREYNLEALAGDAFSGELRVRPQSPAPFLTVRLVRLGSVEVQVRAARTGAPIADATVELRSVLTWGARTDPEGKAVLRGVGSGWRPLHVSAPGYAASDQMLNTQGSGTQVITVALASGYRVSGVALSSTGQPVVGARVAARSTAEPFPVIDPLLSSTVTDQSGAWEMTAVAEGTYQFIAVHDEFADATTATVAVKADVSGVQIRLESGSRVTGEVVDASGAPVEKAQIKASFLSPVLPWASVREAFSDAQGKFALPRMNGQKLSLMAIHGSGLSRVAELDLRKAANAHVRLTIERGEDIAGVVKNDKGEPVMEAKVFARPRQPSSAPAALWLLRGDAHVVADGAGRFTFASLPPGGYSLRAIAPDERADDAGLQRETLAKTGDRDVLVVVSSAGTIVGQVQYDDGTALRSFSVSLGRGQGATTFVQTDRFRVTAPAGAHAVTIYGPGAVSRQVTDVTVASGRETDVGLIRLSRGRSLTGRVLDWKQVPVAGAEVVAGRLLTGGGAKLYIPSESIDVHSTTTGDDGRFNLSGLVGEQVTVVAGVEGKGRADPLTVLDGQDDIDLVLKPTAALQGKVTMNGQPFPNTAVVAKPVGSNANFFVTTGPDGSYAIDTLSVGNYLVMGFINARKDMLVAPVTIEDGKEARVDLNITTGDIVAALKLDDQGGKSTGVTGYVVVSGEFPDANGKRFGDLRELFRPQTPSTVFVRVGTGDSELEALTPGLYTACAATAGPTPQGSTSAGASGGGVNNSIVHCVSKSIVASGDLVVAVPRL